MEKIESRMILEILGRPAEHIVVALNEVIDKIGKEQGVKLVSRKVHEAKPLRDTKDLFTTFAEIEVEFDSVINCFRIVFTYLPANVEIISPETFKMKNDDLNTLVNALAARLHDYDSIAKRLVAEREILVNRLNEKKKDEKTK